MASTYSANLRLELIGTGEQQGTWGSTTNSNLGTLLEQAIGGYESITVSDVGDTTLTTANGSVDQARNMTLNLVGTISAARNVICPSAEKIYIVKNATTGGFSVTFRVNLVQPGVSIPNGSTVIVYVDGTDARLVSQSPVPVTLGGTGATTSADARANLGAAGLGANTFTDTQSINGASLLLNANSDYTPQAQLTHAGATAGSASYSILNRARGTYGSPTIVASGDQLGNLLFQGYDGTAYRSAASIEAQVDGTPGANDMPGRLTFKTTPDGGTAATERMRIDSAGRVGIGLTPTVALDMAGEFLIRGGAAVGSVMRITPDATGSNGVIVDTSWQTGGAGPLIFKMASTERMRIDASGNVGIGTTSPSFKLDVNGNSPSVATVARVYNGDASATAYAGLQTGTGSGLALQMYSYNGIGHVGTTSSNPLVFLSNNTERMRIDAAGAVTVNGTLSAPTAAVDTNTTQVATTAYVVGQGYLKSTTAASTYLTSATASSTYAPLASPALTGNPTAPTPTAGDNDTSIATTAFVTTAVSGATGATTVYTSGSGNYTVPNKSSFLVRMWGGGGGGAHRTTGSLAAYGGGGAGYTEQYYTVAALGGAGATVSYAVGAGGVGGSGATRAGASGGNTTFGSITAYGGGGSTGVNTGGGAGFFGVTGYGAATADGANANTPFGGAVGGTGALPGGNSAYGGAGGGGFVENSPVDVTVGGSSVYGGAGGAGINGNGVNGSAPGGGGGGGNAAGVGGTGGSGRIEIYAW